MSQNHTAHPTDGLGAACTQWQDGRDGGSTPLRAAARVLTGIAHYFDAEFITGQENKARRSELGLQRARLLIQELASSPLRTPQDWNAVLGTDPSGFAGRGLEAKQPYDDQIEQALDLGVLDMPLWGVSLDEEIAVKYGKGKSHHAPRFMITIDGAFPAVPAWVHSGILAEERELICGGRYEVAQVDRQTTTTLVVVRFRELLPII